MKFLKESILLEDITAVKNRYPNISDEDFNRILKLDPTYRDGSNSVGKYTKWLLNLFSKGNLEIRQHVYDLLQQFEAKRNSLQNKDIGQFKSIEQLERTLAETDMPELSDRQKLRKVQKAVHNTDLNKDAELVFESDAWEVWIPKTYEASCRLGRDSRWCTASTENDYYYDRYSSEGPLYINIHKNLPDEKYQFHFESNQFMDINDNAINLSEFLDKHSSLKEFYLPIILKQLGFNDGVNEVMDYCSFDFLANLIADRSRELSASFLESCMSGDVYENFIGGYYDYNYSSNDIINHYLSNIDGDTRAIFFDHGIEEDQIASVITDSADVRQCFDIAISDAYCAGSANLCLSDWEFALESALRDIKFDASDSGYTFYVTRDAAIRLLPYMHDDYYGDVRDIADAIANMIAENIEFDEPYYGWQEFDAETFNMYLHDNLDEVLDSYIDSRGDN